MNAKLSSRCMALAASVLVLSTAGTAFGDEMSAGVTVLRGTSPHMQEQQQQTSQKIELAPPPLPSCPEGYAYSILAGQCYRVRNPLGDDW